MKTLLTALLLLGFYATTATAQVETATGLLQKAFNRTVTSSIGEVKEGEIKITDRGRKAQIVADANKVYSEFLRTSGQPAQSNPNRRAFEPKQLWTTVLNPTTSPIIIEVLASRGSLLSSMRGAVEKAKPLVNVESNAALRQKWETALAKAAAAFKKLEETPADTSARFEVRAFMQLVNPFPEVKA